MINQLRRAWSEIPYQQCRFKKPERFFLDLRNVHGFCGMMSMAPPEALDQPLGFSGASTF